MKRIFQNVLTSIKGNIKPFEQNIKPEQDPTTARIWTSCVPENKTMNEWYSGDWVKIKREKIIL